MPESIFIHPMADVQTERIGEGTRIWQYSIILPGAIVGAYCNVNAHCFLEGDVVLGNNVTLKCGVYLWNGTTIEDDVVVGPNATFTNDMYPRSRRYPKEWAKTKICRGASIGAHAVLLPGLTIGSYAMIGAGSVVTADVPPHELWVGNPARKSGVVCVCGIKLSPEVACPACGQGYLNLSESKLNKDAIGK